MGSSNLTLSSYADLQVKTIHHGLLAVNSQAHIDIAVLLQTQLIYALIIKQVG